MTSPVIAVGTDDGRPDFGPGDVDALADDLLALLGPRGISTLPRALERAGRDGSGMSPILSAQDLGTPDLVCYPRTAEVVPAIVRAAVARGVPVTTRGKGTGNYGQVIPRFGGLVLDMTSLNGIHEITDQTITAQAGARMINLEQTAWGSGSQLWMYPSTVQSTLGGFLGGGSAGTGTIVHGRNHEGFVTALDVVYGTEDAELVHLEGDDAQPFVHTYGVAGVIVNASVRVEPLQEWRCVYASFGSTREAFDAAHRLSSVEPRPRLLSADGPTVVEALPADPAFVRGRANVRGIIDARALEESTDLIAGAGGRVEAVREGIAETIKLSTLSYNHPTWWLQKAQPDRWFHMEVRGDALVTRLEEVEKVYEGGMLHLEVGHGMMFGMLNGIYCNAQQVIDGVAALEELGVGVHSPHQWYVDLDAERVQSLAARTDPKGLLNPGRWM
ncbi:FAD-binding oxidoreductase [Gordonia amicalis]|uniref:FAD-binding oxidoreductase n=1 Tax=Gordonia amicalis TaxID=89053 RepID=UPI00040121E4|nr:FAD-binding oxidoreductase [Gordonia amicalis]MDV7101193.1 FAD-binding oxidoreductase [Gordonia amicalis]MDV7175793.1 FAD-binding oxidoreductase [Gordonia amicalis]UKO92091.1 FAD-binding oxidoreductase [Gordonia amicalis]UOG23356.1 FAD-binding oxidoreductase [Gordonia amicalis]